MNFSFSTFGSVVDEAANKMHIDINTGTLPGADRTSLERDANRARKRFLTKVVFEHNILSHAVNTVADVQTSANVAVGATTIPVVNGSSWPTSGTLLIFGMSMSFTRSGNNLTVAALTFTLESGTYLSLGYALPSNFIRPRSVSVDGVERDVSRKGDTANLSNGTFVIINNNLFLPFTSVSGKTIVIHYVAASPNLTTNNVLDIADFLDDYIIYSLKEVIHEQLYEPELAMQARAKAEAILKEAWSFTQGLTDKRNQYFIPGKY